MQAAWRSPPPPTLWGLQGFHYSCSAPPLLSCDMPASLHIWQQCSIAECTSTIGQWAAREAVITVPLFCWSAQQPHKRKWNVPALILEGVMYHQYYISIQLQGKVATDARTDWDVENLEERPTLQTVSCSPNLSSTVFLSAPECIIVSNTPAAFRQNHCQKEVLVVCNNIQIATMCQGVIHMAAKARTQRFSAEQCSEHQEVQFPFYP